MEVKRPCDSDSDVDVDVDGNGGCSVNRLMKPKHLSILLLRRRTVGESVKAVNKQNLSVNATEKSLIWKCYT